MNACCDCAEFVLDDVFPVYIKEPKKKKQQQQRNEQPAYKFNHWSSYQSHMSIYLSAETFYRLIYLSNILTTTSTASTRCIIS